VKTRPRPTVSRLAALVALPLAALAALPLAALVAGCGVGADPDPPSGPAAAITIDKELLPSTPDPLPALEASPDASPASSPAPAEAGSAEPPAPAVRSAGTTTDLDQLDADLAELDTYLSEADRDLATPEGDLQ
jgi:hypothetical protein